MGNWGSSSSSKCHDTTVFVGRWVELHVAKALENPGVMMIGSSSDFTSKWELVVTKSLSFVLKCTSGYDFRGQFSSSGMYDNKVALHKFTATGKMINITVMCTMGKTKAQKFRVEKASKKVTNGETKGFALLDRDASETNESDDDVSVETTEEASGYDITGLLIREMSILSLQADELNDGKTIKLSRI